jgi:hypothetical protein
MNGFAPLRCAEEVLRRLEHLRGTRGFHVVGIDGKDSAGKSPLGRYLAYHLRCHLVPLDLFMAPGTFPPPLRYDDIARVIKFGEQAGRPLLVEGVMLLHALEKVGRKPDTLIYVRAVSNTGIWFESRFFDSDPDDPEEPYRCLGRLFPPAFQSRTLESIGHDDSSLHRLTVYHQTFAPQIQADIFVEWPCFRETLANEGRQV